MKRPKVIFGKRDPFAFHSMRNDGCGFVRTCFRDALQPGQLCPEQNAVLLGSVQQTGNFCRIRLVLKRFELDPVA